MADIKQNKDVQLEKQPCFTYDIPLTHLSKYEEGWLDKIFRSSKNFFNKLTNEVIERLKPLDEQLSPLNEKTLELYKQIKDIEKTEKEETDEKLKKQLKQNKEALSKEKKKLHDEMHTMKKEWLESNGFTGPKYRRLFGLAKQIRDEQGFIGEVPSTVSRVLSKRIATSLDKYLFSNGKKIHFKPFFEFTYISGEDKKTDFHIDFENKVFIIENAFFSNHYVPQKNARRKYYRQILPQKYKEYCQMAYQKNPNAKVKSFDEWKNMKINQFKKKKYKMILPLNIDEKNEYLMSCIRQNKVKYVGLKRKLKGDRWTYYACVTALGTSPQAKMKKNIFRPLLENLSEIKTAGLDLGPSTAVLTSADNDGANVQTDFFKLGYKSLDERMKRIKDLDTFLENSRIISNPDCFQEDGQHIKGKKLKNFSKKYNKIKMKRKYEYECLTETKKNKYNYLAKEIVSTHGPNIKIENNQIHQWAQKKKKTEYKNVEMTVTNKKGETKTLHKVQKSKKQHGKSILKYSPKTFVNSIDNLLNEIGVGSLTEIDAYKTKASQYDHIKDEYIKVGLGVRAKEIDGYYVPRDAYSSFIILNANEHGEVNKEMLSKGFNEFCEEMPEAVKRAEKAGNISKNFGFDECKRKDRRYIDKNDMSMMF